MKYPESQFSELKNYLKKAIEFLNIDKQKALANCCSLQYFIYSQTNFVNNPNVKMINGQRLFEVNTGFKLYPDGCNDNHIETAVKKAINEIL